MIVKYISYNGLSFDDAESCEKYESDHMDYATNIFKSLVVKCLSDDDILQYLNSVGGGSCDECWFNVLVRIKNMDDLNIAQLFLNNIEEYTGYKMERKFTIDDIGKELIVSVGDITDGKYKWCHIYGTIDECVEEYRKALMQFKANNN